MDEPMPIIPEPEVKIEKNEINVSIKEENTLEKSLSTANVPDEDSEMEILEQEDLPDTETIENVYTLPEISKETYEKRYHNFMEWCTVRNIEEYTEPVLLQYFKEQSKTYKSATIFVIYSMIRATLSIRKNVDISKYKELMKFLKKYADEKKPEKFKSFTRDEVNRFLTDAPDETYLLSKVILIMGLAGRRTDFPNLRLEDITDLGSAILIKTADKTIQRHLTLTNFSNNSMDFLSFFRKYLSLRPKNVESSRFFVQFIRGKCTAQVMGKNSFGKIAQRIAEFLKLPDPKSYTGHCLRATSVTLKKDFDKGLIGHYMKQECNL